MEDHLAKIMNRNRLIPRQRATNFGPILADAVQTTEQFASRNDLNGIARALDAARAERRRQDLAQLTRLRAATRTQAVEDAISRIEEEQAINTVIKLGSSSLRNFEAQIDCLSECMPLKNLPD